jgi:hypothetical protein
MHSGDLARHASTIIPQNNEGKAWSLGEPNPLWCTRQVAIVGGVREE